MDKRVESMLVSTVAYLLVDIDAIEKDVVDSKLYLARKKHRTRLHDLWDELHKEGVLPEPYGEKAYKG